VSLVLTDDGVDRFGELAATCRTPNRDCQAGQIAIVVGGEVAKWRSGEVAKWRSGEVAKWRRPGER